MRLVIGPANLWKPVSGGGLGEVESDKNNRWTDRRNHTHFTIVHITCSFTELNSFVTVLNILARHGMAAGQLDRRYQEGVTEPLSGRLAGIIILQ